MRKSLLLHSTLAAALTLGAVAPGLVAAPAFAEALPAVPLTAAPADFSDVVEAVSPAVVSILVETRGPSLSSRSGGSDLFRDAPPELRDFFERFGRGSPFGERENRRSDGGRGSERGGEAPREGRRGSGQGSGFFISADGYVVTNNHVVQNAVDVKIKLNSGRELNATLVGADERTDLALLKVSGENFPYVRFGDSDKARVGQWVVTVGNPFGLGGTATAGIVSAVGRDIGAGSYDDFIQIDAPINRGNSGGPAFNLQGEVLGVNTVIFSPSGGSVGIGFAISSNMAKEVVANLQANGRVERGWLGVAIQPLTPELAEGFGIPEVKGALISHVEPDSPAAQAGLRVRDVVTKFAGRSVEDARGLSRAVAGQTPGQSYPAEILRDGRRTTVSVKIGAMPGAPDEAAAETPLAAESGESARLGLSLRNAPGGGVLVNDVRADSAAEEAGISEGDLVVGVGGKEVATAAEAAAAIRGAQAEGRKSLVLQLQKPDEDRSLFVALPLSDS